MAPLSQASAVSPGYPRAVGYKGNSYANALMQQAIARLRVYVPPPSAYSSLPLSRRAAVLILLFADRRGDLRVVLTMRANTLKSCIAT